MDGVEVVPSDPEWPLHYEAERTRLLAALPASLVCGAEHFGSTAIPGMVAKPVIDILIAVRSLDAARAGAVGVMEGLGYAFWADNPARDRLFFVRGLPPAPRRTHHVHMTELDGDLWARLLFRDHLRAHPDDAARYAALKRVLADRHRDDREAYTAAKAAFVDNIMAHARAAAARRPGAARSREGEVAGKSSCTVPLP